MRQRGALLALAASCVLASCNLFISDWQVGEGAGGSASSSSASASTEATSSTDASSTAQSASSGVGGAGGGIESAALLETEDIAGGGLAVFREGFFRIEADASTEWQWKRWFYLPFDPELGTPLGPFDHVKDEDNPYYRTLCLWTAYRIRQKAGGNPNSQTCAGQSNEDFVEPTGAPELHDVTPVWFDLGVTLDGGSPAMMELATRVYASGRVWTHVHVLLQEDFGDSDVGFGQIQLQDTEFEEPTAGEEGLYRMNVGGGAILSVDVGELDPLDPGGYPGFTWMGDTSEPSIDAGTMYYALQSFESGDESTFIVPFHLGSADELSATREARMADLRTPGLVAVGATSQHEDTTGSVDPKTGAYDVVVDDGASTVSLAPSDAADRFEPAFDLHGWTSESWTVTLDGEAIVSSAAQGPNALGILKDGVLSFQYLGTITQGATAEQRTFVITAD